MTEITYREELDKIYTDLSFQKRELVRELEELNDLKGSYHNGNTSLSAKDFRKVESQIEITKEKISLLLTDRKKLKNNMRRENLIKDV